MFWIQTHRLEYFLCDKLVHYSILLAEWAISNMHPWWTTFYPGGQRTILTKGRGILWVNLIVSKGESVTNYGIQGDTPPLLGDVPSIN